jgi:transcriptional regulator with XRE-family HTH domain
MPERDFDPSVYRRRLRNALRRMRESQGVTQGAAAAAMEWSVSKLIRIEAGTVAISVNDLKALLEYYGVTGADEVKALIRMAKNTKRNSWLSGYKGVAGDVFLTFLGHEDAAARSYSFQPILVPGLLQTDEYALEVLRVIRGSKDPQRINRLVELRLARQERVFSRSDGIKLNYLLDESVVRRVVGGPEIMRRQVRHLLDSIEQESLTIRILPFRCGMYRSMRVPFVVLEFAETEDEAILYLEHPQGEALIREDGPYDAEGGADPSDPTAPPTYLQIFGELRQLTSETETLNILRAALGELDEADGPAS